jgi:hypothetical protein
MKASEDYVKLRELIGAGYIPVEINIKLQNDKESATLELQKGDELIRITSLDGDVVFFAFTVKQLFNKLGAPVIGEIVDLNDFYNTLQKLNDPENKKLNEVRDQLISGSASIDYNPHDLIHSFLEDPSRLYKPYLKLRDDYYLIKCLHVEHLKVVCAGIVSIKKQAGLKNKIFNSILDLFNKAFHQNKNFVKNYQQFQRYNQVNAFHLLDSMSQAMDHDQDKFEMLSKCSGVPAVQGMKYLLESYATLAESVIKVLNILRAAIEIELDIGKPDANKRSIDNWTIIKQHPSYSFIVDNFDPRIRHGKAHNCEEIDVENSRVIFYREGRLKKISVSYSFEEFRQMWHRLHLLSSALIVAVCVEEAALTGTMLESDEFKLLLAGLGNFKEM